MSSKPVIPDDPPTFTFHTKFSRAIFKRPPEEWNKIVIAIWRYAELKEEPCFEPPLDAIFEIMREDIEHSVDKYKSAKSKSPSNQEPKKARRKST